MDGPHEVRITFDPFKAANIGLDLTGISSELGSKRGCIGRLKRRSAGASTPCASVANMTSASLGELVLEWREGKPIRLKDIARIDLKMVDPSTQLHQNGGPSLAVNVIPESGA